MLPPAHKNLHAMRLALANHTANHTVPSGDDGGALHTGFDAAMLVMFGLGLITLFCCAWWRFRSNVPATWRGRFSSRATGYADGEDDAAFLLDGTT
jgi:hypothetical protein